MLEAGFLSFLTNKRKIYVTYQCDVNLSNSIIDKLIMKTMDISSKILFSRANRIIVSSLDYACNSRTLPKYKDKWNEIHPVSPLYAKINSFSQKGNTDNVYIGFCGRIVEEKGIDYFLKSAPVIKEKIPNAVFIVAGDYQNVAGGSTYHKLKEDIGWNGQYVKFLGRLTDEELIAFYSKIDLLVLPSINSLEAFGMVQVEAMLSGVPVVATNLPGVRGIIQKTGMGEIIEPRSVMSLVDGVLKVLNNKEKYLKSKEYIEDKFGGQRSIEKYVSLFDNKTQTQVT